jgi:hypothetical protein
LCSCSKTVYVPVETVRTEYRNTLSRDSVFVLDSVIIRAKADTVWYEKYRYAYRDRMLHDTVQINDTVRVPYPVEKVKEVNRLEAWQVILMLIGSAAVAGGLIWIYLKIKR